ncbi:MAG TPA: hypothetical protein PKN59_03105 [Syntrophales bacterium]|nr:hypothetical protein [Syntrophales bacterium]
MTDLLSVQDYEQIVKAVGRGMAECTAEKCFTEDQVHEAVRYVKGAIMGYACARLILTGDMLVFFEDGQMLFALTEKGQARLNEKFGGARCKTNA